MAQLFSFENLKVSFEKSSKSMDVEILYENERAYLTIDHILELEQLVNWSATHLEISSITLHSNQESLGRGFNPALFDRIDEAILQTILARIQKLTYAIFFLPQTTIVNIGLGVQGVMSELIIPFDIKIANEKTNIRFNHLFKGRTPACGGIGFLQQMVAPSFARRWILQATTIDSAELLSSGYIQNFADVIDPQLLINISEQSQTARIQAKRALLETILPELDRALDSDKRFAFASLMTGDWKNQLDFKNPKELATALKMQKSEPPETFDNVINFRRPAQ
jgi:enoyl-CoA hydratase/carnithine racemase